MLFSDRKDREMSMRMGQVKRLDKFVERNSKSIIMPPSVIAMRPSLEDFRKNGVGGVTIAERNVMKLFQKREDINENSFTTSNGNAITKSVIGASTGMTAVKAPSPVPGANASISAVASDSQDDK